MPEKDQFGHVSYLSDEIADLLYQFPDLDLRKFLVADPKQFNESVQSLHSDLPKLSQYEPLCVGIEDFDEYMQQYTWKMPEEYQQLDIAKWVLDQCKTEAEIQRVANELLLYDERKLFNLLRFMKYFVDTIRKQKLFLGVGRGSSVASYVLYLIGVHRINSLYYDLPIEEFLK